MQSATERLQEVTQITGTTKPKIALDTNCIRYFLNTPPDQPWADCLEPIIKAGLDGKLELYVSNVVVSELLSNLHYENRHKAGYDPELTFMATITHHFELLDVNDDVAKQAGRLRGTYLPSNKMTLKTPDALIGATSMTNGHALFVTNDAKLANALPPSNCIYLRNVALEWLDQNFPKDCYDGSPPVSPLTRGEGFPNGMSLATLELGSIKPNPSAKWRRILKDGQTAASALNESCIFFILTSKKGRKVETQEVLFWHESLTDKRPPWKVIKRLHNHMGYSKRTGILTNPGNHIYVFIFASLAHERAKMDHPSFASKSDHQKEADAWNNYLSPFRIYRDCLTLPQTTWLLCEDKTTQPMNVRATKDFLDKAKNVLGWRDDSQ